MKRLLITCGIIVLSVCELALGQNATQPVTLVIHVDAGKKQAPPLSKSDVLILDNDTKIDAVSVVEAALTRDATFAVVVDASGSNRDKIDFIRKSVIDVFDAMTSAPGSRGLLFVFADTIAGGTRWVQRAEAEQVMRGFRVKQGGPTALYGAIVDVAKRLGQENGTSRRLLFVITDGDDNAAGVSSQDAVDACLSAGVTVIPIGLLSYEREKVGKKNLRDLADATGGRAVILDRPADVKSLVSNVLKSEYLVTFNPTKAAGYHRLSIEMQSAPKGTSLKVPKGYYAR